MIVAEKIAELPGHQNPIFTVEASQKPGIIFTAGNDKGVVEWSLKRNEFIKVICPVKTSVYALHAPESQPQLFIGERSGEASVYDFNEQRVIGSLKHHQLPVFDIKSVATKNEILLSSEDGTVSVWRAGSFELVYQFSVSAQTVRVIALSPDGRLVAFGCKDHVVKIYNLEDYTFITQLDAHTLPITSLQFSPDGRHLLSGSRDAGLKIWNTTDFSLFKEVAAHLFTIYDIKYHPTLPLFATASRDKTIRIWSAIDFRLRKVLSRDKGYDMHRLSINKICWAGDTLVSVSDDKLVMTWAVTETD